ncbi:hypothetical protein QFW77_02950 [Luteimonas sp. RD2P54]|uniref:Saccharopine dehydrogenase NADP binding domain-containing protein n=1 Tax=Luteimonas endophytica TaxID=3042023 RepID=A0ABT6J553_9GAMM|nr:hypothetical protein [Luteimonas endophytica]MDH5821952.1 hypothetical protein [Luteimonas endophytica]
MTAPVLVLGGYGSVGSKTIRMLRRLHPELPVTIAGRDLAKAHALAAELGHARGAPLDLTREDLGLPEDGAHSLVLTAVRDLSLRSLRFAQARGLPYVALSDGVFELGPTVAQYAQRPSASAVLLLGHGMGAVPMMSALELAGEFRSVEAIQVGLVFDPEDPLGPASAVDMDRIARIGPAPLLRERGSWAWAGEASAAREFTGVDGRRHAGTAVGLVDVLGLASAGAPEVRVDLAEAPTASRLAGGAVSHEVIVEIRGDHRRRGRGRYRRELVDPEGYAFLSARGIALAIERMLGLDGRSAPAPGLYFPETLMAPAGFMQRLRALGVSPGKTRSN